MWDSVGLLRDGGTLATAASELARWSAALEAADAGRRPDEQARLASLALVGALDDLDWRSRVARGK